MRSPSENFRRDFETVEEYRIRLAREDQAEPAPQVVEPKAAEPPAVTTPIKPGNYYARLAYEAGCEDEYSNRMKARYGGEW